ncbi:MAG: hydroxymethylbilane synthase [Akkermansiaceae bacterium]|nr:hydroxymethylbilane synthase [Akkermansiaceae bacterium]NNM28260.1 hydroxymethylbilane synthase [Akkermansiaceae bacterium]
MAEGGNQMVLGTRGSALALVQAEMAEAALAAAHPDLEIIREVITTTGDRRTDIPLAEVAAASGHIDKGVFIKELEVALERGEVDAAVHSLKDVPSELDAGFALGAVLPRAAIGDVLVTKAPGGLEGLPDGAVVATSSVRRARQLRWLRPDLAVAEIRGNVPTRLRKLAEHAEIDGLILAEAGLARLNLLAAGRVECAAGELWGTVLDPDRFLPAASQGAVALEIRDGDERLRGIAGAIHDAATGAVVEAERAFLRILGAGCDTPVGVLSAVSGGQLRIRARVFEDGEESPLEAVADGPLEKRLDLAAELRDKLARIQR